MQVSKKVQYDHFYMLNRQSFVLTGLLTYVGVTEDVLVVDLSPSVRTSQVDARAQKKA